MIYSIEQTDHVHFVKGTTDQGLQVAEVLNNKIISLQKLTIKVLHWLKGTNCVAVFSLHDIRFLKMEFNFKPFLASGAFCHLLITFTNNLDPYQDRQNDLDPLKDL